MRLTLAEYVTTLVADPAVDLTTIVEADLNAGTHVADLVTHERKDAPSIPLGLSPWRVNLYGQRTLCIPGWT